ncbi:hypothetical protein ABZV58_17810 [Nocardia sp. NPDC004654]|uniref:hypothetical protein n=1 Tax=Nocardia sp. NPDC004654 TaxID=3154776 RepID=UPI0033AFF9F3
MTRNLILLEHRLPDHRKIGLELFKCSPQKVIALLYTYRSAVAHGGSTAATLKWFGQHQPAGQSLGTAVNLHLLYGQ